MNILPSFLTSNPCYTAGEKITVRGLMLHSVGTPQPSAARWVKSWNDPQQQVCVHAFIDAGTGDVYQTLPWDCRGWHCGGSGNNTHIGVEMCEPDTIRYTGGAAWQETGDGSHTAACVARTYNAAVELFAFLCETYGLDPLRDGVILSHKEGCARGIASNHSDPEHLWQAFGYTMDGFRAAVAAAMQGNTVAEAPPVQQEEARHEAPADKPVDIFYRVQTQKHGWLPEVKNRTDYAGWEDSPITGVALRVSAGNVRYRVHVAGGGWLSWITGCDIQDYYHGYAGNGKPIDAVEIYYVTPEDIRPYKRARYRVMAQGRRDYWDWQYDTETTNGQDGYAGTLRALPLVRLQAEIC